MDTPDFTLHSKKKLFISVSIAGIVIILIGAGMYAMSRGKQPYKGQATTTQSTSSDLTYSVEGLDPTIQTQIVKAANASLDNYTRQTSAAIEIVSSPTASDTIFELPGTAQPEAITQATILTTPVIKLGVRSRTISAEQREQIATALSRALKPKNTWTYLALGDIIPARDVYTYSRRLGYLYPYSRIKETTRSADLTVSNIETTIADNQAFLQGEGVLNFTAPKSSLDGLLESGIDGVNLANNHSMNGGATKVSEMLVNLQAAKIGSFGVGLKGADSSWKTTVKGVRITHLGYDTVPGNSEPTASSPGAQRIPLKPWGTLSAADTSRVQSDIQAAKAQNDVVIPWFHWGTEYTHTANEEQRALAHAAIDAGAEVVIGTHPHWTQGIEWYKGHLIVYSLGNFVFDQNWSEETKRSVALELTFSDAHVTGARLMPARIENWVQPVFLEATSPIYSQILKDIADHSWWSE